MNKTEILFKADTGLNPKIEIEFEETEIYIPVVIIIKNDLLKHFKVIEDLLVLHSHEYVKWLEKKLEQLNSK